MKRLLLLAVTAAAVLLSSCAKKDAGEARHATLTLRDGTSVSGSVVTESAAAVKILGDDKITREIPRDQIQQMNYDQAPAQAAVPANAAPADTTAPPQPQQPATAAAPPVQPVPATRKPSPAAPATAPPSAPPAAALAPAQEPVTSRTYTAPAGAELSVRTDETIDSGTATEGQVYPASITASVKDANGDVVIPKGARAQLVIRSASQGGKIRGASDLVLDVQSVVIGGRAYQLSTADLQQQGRDGVGVNKRTGVFAGGGAALGAVIGAIAGGGKGAAIGAGSGAAAGAATQVLTKGKIKVPAETILTFRLDKALHVVGQ
jgi:hypothetical protein